MENKRKSQEIKLYQTEPLIATMAIKKKRMNKKSTKTRLQMFKLPRKFGV